MVRYVLFFKMHFSLTSFTLLIPAFAKTIFVGDIRPQGETANHGHPLTSICRMLWRVRNTGTRFGSQKELTNRIRVRVRLREVEEALLYW